MEQLDHLAHLRSEGGRLVGAATAAGLLAEVPTCRDWTVADLLVHIAKVFRRTTFALRSGTAERPAGRDWNMEPPSLEALTAWYDRELADVIAALEATGADAPVWSFSPGHSTAGFWRRRLAHEAAVHRVDVERAGGEATPVPAPLAVDGVDELLEVFLAGVAPEALAGTAATVHLHATDVEGEWLVGLGPDGVTSERGHAKGDAAARGSASDLLLWLWGRAPEDGLERFGDPAALERLRAVVAGVT